jgi:DNA repair exonuclease SbcCD ATPase subunit
VNPSAWDYIRKAFSARPIGMFVPPNWIGIGVFGLLGLVNPGFWVVGLGLELGYLWILGTNERFQRFVGASQQILTRKQWQEKVDSLVQQLNSENQQRYRTLESRCRALLDQQLHLQTPPQALQAQNEGLGRLLWLYLRLLSTRQAIQRMLRGATEGSLDASADLEERIGQLKVKLNEPLSEDLRKSLTGQIEILEQRLERRREAKEKLAFLDAELMRIQEQIELVREQAVLTADPETISTRVDQITTTLGSTSQWVSDQQKIYGAVEDLMSEPPAMQMINDERRTANYE